MYWEKGVGMGAEFYKLPDLWDQGLLVSSNIWNGQEKKTGFLETKIYFIPLIFL
jgi:hypothetical protein